MTDTPRVDGAGAPLVDVARRLRRAAWVERRCFEIWGSWVAVTPEPGAKLLFARQSHHHAWHAEVFDRLFPVASGFELPEPAPDPGWTAFMDAVAAAPTTADRLVGACRVVGPALVAIYADWVAGANPVSDAALLRWLRFVLQDERDDLAEGGALLATLVSPGAEAGAEARRGALEARRLAAGPLL